jgi:FkbM family methyltransferase
MKLILKILQNIDNLVTYIFSNLSKENIFIKDFFGKKKITLFDIGSNLGGYTDLVIKNININEIHIFEPSKKCFEYLKTRFNKKKIYLNNKALSNSNKISTFYENEVLSQSSLHNKKNKFNSNLKNTSRYKIKCTTLDTYYYSQNKKNIIDLIKIDAEGEDLNVLKGSKKLLKNKKIKLIKIELLNSFFGSKKKSNINEIILFLNKYNYHIITITKTKFVKEKLLMMDVYFSQNKL